MTCNEVQRLIELYVLDALEDEKYEKVRKHLSVCTICSSIESEYSFVRKTIQDNIKDDEKDLFFANKIITNSKSEIKRSRKRVSNSKVLTQFLSFAACIALTFGFFIEIYNFGENKENVLQCASIPHAASAFFKTRLDNFSHSSLRAPSKDNTLIVNNDKIVTVIEDESGYKAE